MEIIRIKGKKGFPSYVIWIILAAIASLLLIIAIRKILYITLPK